MSSGVSFASRASSPSSSRTVKFGTLLSPGATASYPTSFASSPQYNPSSARGASKLSAGVIAGIVVACVAFVLLVAFVIFLLVARRRKANRKNKRLSRTALLPAPGEASENQPDMLQRPNYASTGVTFPAATAAPAAPIRKNRLHAVPGLSFGSGHRRTDSNNSTTPFLGSPPDSPSRPSIGGISFEGNRSPTANRYSLESATTYPGSPTMANHGNFEAYHDGSASYLPQNRLGGSP